MIATNPALRITGVPGPPSAPLPGTGSPGPIFTPPQGPSIPGLPIGGGVCPEGTHCVGPSFDSPIGSLCLGTCVTTTTPPPSPETEGDWQVPGCPEGWYGAVDENGRLICAPGQPIMEPTGPIPTGGNGQVAGGCGYSACGPRQAVLPTVNQQTGQKCCPPGYHLNQSTYFLKDGTCVGRMSRCVRNRTLNPANSRAGSRAATRLIRHKKALQKIERAISRASSPRRRK